MDLAAILAEIFSAETIPEDASSRITEAYEFDTGSAAAKVSELEQIVAAKDAEITALKLFNFDRLMNGPTGDASTEDEPTEDEPDEDFTTDDLFTDSDEDDTDTKDDE